MIELRDCLKTFTEDLDKVVTPGETVARVRAVLEEKGEGVLAETRRIDSGRLGIPVFLSMCGPAARAIMPTRKQMGKGASPEQAEASALMELVERFSFFHFWETPSNFVHATWDEARELWGDDLIPVSEMLQSVDEEMDEADALRLLNLVSWKFCPALHLPSETVRHVPLGWFKMLNEFNGSSAGNTNEEALLQGGCELVERHVSALVDRDEPILPTISPQSLGDGVLGRLYKCFTNQGIKIWLKDFSMDMPVPTVGALAYDPSTFPGLSEIVFTAGTAASPEKAAIRALTEVAQLAGDFHTGSNYEASGLSKYGRSEDIAWLCDGPEVPLDSLPGVESENILDEIRALTGVLARKGFSLYSVNTTHPDLELPALYSFVPGFRFRERTPNTSLGLFIGRMLAEQAEPSDAVMGLKVIGDMYPDAPFVPFLEGLVHLRTGDASVARLKFEKAAPLQLDAEDRALSLFYAGFALTQEQRWEQALPLLDDAIALSPEVKEFHNLRGVSLFKKGEYRSAAGSFQAALNLDSGSAMDLANLGMCHKFLGEHAQARDYLAAALKLDPELIFAREHLEELGPDETENSDSH